VSANHKVTVDDEGRPIIGDAAARPLRSFPLNVWYADGLTPDGAAAALLGALARPSADWEAGFSSGQSDIESDYDFALTEYAGWPDDADTGPMAVAERLRAISNALSLVVSVHPGEPTQDGGSACHWCCVEGEVHATGDGAERRVWTTYDHEDDCAFAAARRLLGRDQS
jgi:hypothetical protein